MSRPELPTIVQVEVDGGPRSAFFAPERVRIGVGPGFEVPLLDTNLPHGSTAAELFSDGAGYRLRDGRGECFLRAGTEIDVPCGTQRCVVRVGMTIPFGRYLLTGALSEGGMAQVLSARLVGPRDLVFGERAIKLIHANIRNLPDVEDMFLDEARIASEIRHPNVVRIFDIGIEAGLLFLAMELVQGITLRSLLKKFQARSGSIPVAMAAALVSQACRGLHAAHEVRDAAGAPMQVVHRDVSPHNLLCSSQGVVQVIDFGVARALGRIQHSALGQFKGKPAYAAPEQVRGPSIDRRADVFAAAVVLYELCTGHQPFSRDSDYATLFAVLQDDAREMRALRRDIPRTLETLVHGAMAKDPDRRPQTAAAFADQLEALVRSLDERFLTPSEIVRFLAVHDIAINDTGPAVLLAPPQILRQPNTPSPPPPPPTAVRPPPIPVAAMQQRPLSDKDTLLFPRTPPGVEANALRSAPEATTAKALGSPQPRVDVEHQVFLVPANDSEWQQLGPKLQIRTLAFSLDEVRQARALPLNEIPGLLPAPLQVSLDNARLPALVLEIAAVSTGRRGSDRPALYLNAAEPSTRLASYLINGDLPNVVLEIGHRRLGVRRVGISALTTQRDGIGGLQFACEPLGITFAANALRLAIIYAPAGPDVHPSHIVCVRVG